MRTWRHELGVGWLKRLLGNGLMLFLIVSRALGGPAGVKALFLW